MRHNREKEMAKKRLAQKTWGIVPHNRRKNTKFAAANYGILALGP